MKVYHLEIEVMFALEDTRYVSKVYSTMKKAVEEGKYYLEKEMRALYTSGYQIKGQEDITIDQLFSIERTDYTFTVTEIDLKYAESFDTDLFGQNLWSVKPTHIKYGYNYKGKLEYKNIQWIKKQKTLLERIYMGKEDFKKDAGTKFKIGDIVTVKDASDLTYKKLFVVRFLPRRVKGTEYFKNTYAITSTYDREAILSGIFTWEYRESELKKYNGKIDPASPIGVLQRIIKRDVYVFDSLWQGLKNGLVSFDTRINYKEYIEENTCEFEYDDWGYNSTHIPTNRTGLPVSIYPSKNYNGIKDNLPKIRIGNSTENYNDTFYLTLEEEPKVVIGKCKLSKEDLKKVCDYIKDNLDTFLKHFDPKNEDFSDFDLWEELEQKGAIKEKKR